MYKLIAPLAAMAIFASTQGALAALECGRKFDRNRNGIVDVGKEINVCILHSTSSVHKKYDGNLNGEIDADELAKLEYDARHSSGYITSSLDTSDRLGTSPGIEPGKPIDAAPPNTERFNTTNGFLLRKAYTAPSTIQAPVTGKGKEPTGWKP